MVETTVYKKRLHGAEKGWVVVKEYGAPFNTELKQYLQFLYK